MRVSQSRALETLLYRSHASLVALWRVEPNIVASVFISAGGGANPLYFPWADPAAVAEAEREMNLDRYRERRA